MKIENTIIIGDLFEKSVVFFYFSPLQKYQNPSRPPENFVRPKFFWSLFAQICAKIKKN